MKKFLCLAATGMFLFSACSNDGDPKDDPGPESGTGQELILRVANTGDGLTTKAGRPLYSSEATQTIDKVKVAIFSLGTGDALTGCLIKSIISGATHLLPPELYITVLQMTALRTMGVIRH